MNNKIKKPSKKFYVIGKLVKIDWEDHYSVNGGWSQITSRDWEPHVNSSVGKIVREDGKSLVLAPSWSTVNDNVADHIYILKSCIIKRKILK